MKESPIYNEKFLKKIFNGQQKKGLAIINGLLGRMSFEDRVKYVVDRLSEMKFIEARMRLEFWEKSSDVIDLFEKCNVEDFKLIREYKGKMTSGIIDAYFVGAFDSHFLKVLITKHFSFGKTSHTAINVWPLFAIDDGVKITAIKLYSDKEYKEYIWLKK